MYHGKPVNLYLTFAAYELLERALMKFTGAEFGQEAIKSFLDLGQ